MERHEGGLFVAYVKEAKHGDMYKYLIHGYDGQDYYKADPFAFYSELRPGTASRVYDLPDYGWTDEKFLKKRARTNLQKRPVSIYEMHLGSWRQHEDGSFFTYRETADELVPYLKKMGFTHVEFMPLTSIRLTVPGAIR